MQLYQVELVDEATGETTTGMGMYTDAGDPPGDVVARIFQQKAEEQCAAECPHRQPLVTKVTTIEGRVIFERPTDEN